MTDFAPGVNPAESLMSGRTPAVASKFGYDGLLDFAQSLPPDARVVDVGAGLSTLGRGVCNLRGDVEWINADPNYGNFLTPSHERSFEDLLETKPNNLHYERVDAVHLVEAFGPAEFDRVVSYWAIQYIIMQKRERGVRAAENMLRAAKPSGSVAVGPVRRPFYSLAALRDLAMEVTPAPDEAGMAAQAEEIVEANALLPYQAKNARAMLEKRAARAAANRAMLAQAEAAAMTRVSFG